ncbi:SDR family NAD(P)-dependent oxidoreductase [Oceanicoccus sagamiensis]|nr:SDR family oxidoreductase [Oceanicoccus sagamiensis]
MSFENKVILITGAASGFGKLLAETLSPQGAKLILGDLNEAGVKAVADSLPGEAVAMVCNVAVEEEVKALVEASVTHFGGLDIAVNNAGISSPPKSLLEITEKEMDINFAVNAKSILFGMKYQIPLMLENGGNILNVASAAGMGGAPKLAHYCAAKHAAVGLTKTAALEFARQNVRVNAICPYFTQTPMVDGARAAGMGEIMEKGSPMKRLGEPEEIVSMMMSIMMPSNSYMTGQCINVDGGVSAF